jgi:hypothetical protein
VIVIVLIALGGGAYWYYQTWHQQVTPASASSRASGQTPSPQTAATGLYKDPFTYCKAVVTRDGGEGGVDDSRYVGTQPPDAVIHAMMKKVGVTESFAWRCMNGNVYGCYLGASGRGCRIADTSERQVAAIRTFCAENPNSSIVPNSVNYSASDWTCNGNTPIVVESYPVDHRGYMAGNWVQVLEE